MRHGLHQHTNCTAALAAVECRSAPTGEAGEVGDMITAPKSWHFSNRSDDLDDKRQEAVAEQASQQKKEQ